MHGGIAHQADQSDLCGGYSRLRSQLLQKLPQHRQDALLQDRLRAGHGRFDPGDHIRTVAGLGVHGTGGGEKPAGFSVQQKSHQGRGADVEGGGIGVEPVGVDRCGQAVGQDGGSLPAGEGDGHALKDTGLTGQDGLFAQRNLAFSAGPLSAAGRVGMEAGGDLGLQQGRSGLDGRGDVVGKKGHLKHPIPSL